ncbi:hypothetical protein E4T56_gene4306 [Termitomyces sp. T112]|nr:hypothetical protein E4T56_gene4306 [Termitomyces sp. T112]
MSSSAYSPAASPSPLAHSSTSSFKDSEGWWDHRARREWDLAWRDKDIAMRTTIERLSQLQELQACMGPLVAWAEMVEQQLEGSEVWGTQQGPSIGEAWVAAERAQWQEEWLANEAASEWQEVLWGQSGVSGSADLGGSAALGESLLGGRDPLALVTEHSKTFRALVACADSWWDVIRTDPGGSGEVGLRGNEMVLVEFRQKTVWEIHGSEGVGGCVINGNGARRVIAVWETKLKRGRRFVRVLLNQLKALGVPRGFPNFVMSSPSVPVVSPADLDEVMVYDSGGEEFERRRRGSVRNWSQSSMVVVVDFLGVPKRTKFCPALPKGKGASSAMVWGKCRASPPSEAGPSKRPRGCESLAGPPGSSLFSPTPGIPSEWSLSPPAPIPLITEVFLHKQVEALTTLLEVREGELQQVREDHDMARTEKEVMERERNTSVRVAMERALEVRGLREHLMQMEGQPAGEAEGRGRAPEGDALWVELEAARRREDWSANEAALGHAGILCWVREHRVLLDGASAVFASIQDGLTQGSAVQPLELQQGMVRLERLLAGHWRRNAVAPGLWWEVAADAGEALPGLAEILAVVRAQMEVDLGVGLPVGPGRG